MKKVFALALVAFAVIGFMTAPSFAEALSDEQQNALTMLLRSFGADDPTIQNFQGAVLGATTGPTDDYGSDGTSTSGVYCPKLTTTMQRGARDATTGGQVTELQLFLADYFNLNEEDIATGFFGRLTQTYVVKFQQEKGLPSFGIVGSLTRAAIAQACGAGQTGTGNTNPGTSSLPDTGTTVGTGGVDRNGLTYSLVLKGGSTTGGVAFVEGKDIGTFELYVKNTASTTKSITFPNNCWYTYTISDITNGGRVIFDLSSVQQCIAASSQSSKTFTLRPGESFFIDNIVHRFQTAHVPPGNYGLALRLNAREVSDVVAKLEFKVWAREPGDSKLYCSLASDKSSYIFGENITVKWVSNGAYAEWYKDTEKDTFFLGGDKLAISGSATFTANVLGNPYLNMRAYDAKGNTATCKIVIPVNPTGTSIPRISITTAGPINNSTATGFTVEYGNMPSAGVHVVNEQNTALWTQELTSGGNGSLFFEVRPALPAGYYSVQAFDSRRTVVAQSARHFVNGPSAIPTVTIQITPSTITVGESSTLTWNSYNANRCHMSYGSIQEIVPLSGTWTINNNTTTKYTLRCTNDPGTGKDGPTSEASATLTVVGTSAQTNPVVISSFSTSATSVTTGQPITLTWNSNLSSTDISYYQGFCAISLLTDSNQQIHLTGGSIGSANGSVTYVPPASGTYTLRCSSGAKDGSPMAEKTLRVTVGSTASSGELYAVGVYEAAGAQHNFCYSKPGTVNVNLVQLVGTKKGTPVTLSLSAYEPVIWNINVPTGVNLQKVILSGYNVQSPVITGASPLVERYFYNDPADAARGISPAGSFYDERQGADSRFQTIYSWAGQATCASTSGAVPIASRWYYNGGSNYFYAYQKTDSNYSTLVGKLQSLTGLTLKNFQGAYSGSTFTVTVGTPEY